MTNRLSNIELLRLIAMFMVLTLHTLHLAQTIPTGEELMSHPCVGISRTILCLGCMVAVNVFVLISGWFGIKLSFQSVVRLFTQCLYALCISWLISWAWTGNRHYEMLLSSLYIGEGLWFVPAYLGLMVMSSFLNAFIEHSNEKTLRMSILAYFLYEMFYGYIGHDMANFQYGYSFQHFIAIYLLARYLRLYPNKYTRLSRYQHAFIYLFITIFAAFLVLFFVSFLTVRYSDMINLRIISYNSPLIIISSTSLLLAFTKIKVGPSKVINILASSSFSIYLIQDNLMVRPIHSCWTDTISNQFSGIVYVIIMSIFIILTGLTCIFLDFPRARFWNNIVSKRIHYKL